MYNRKIVPTNFKVPEKYETDTFLLTPLNVNDLIQDYEAVMVSVGHLKGLMDQSVWPEGLTIEDNLVDLGWHQREFSLAHSFAYAVRGTQNKTYLGCCYIYPSNDRRFEIQVFYWIREDRNPEVLEMQLGKCLRDWLKTSWPFCTVDYPGRV